MATQHTQPKGDVIVLRYHGDPEKDEFFYSVPARDLTAWEWESTVEPGRRRDVLTAKTTDGKSLYTAVGTRLERLAEAGLADVIFGDDIPTAGALPDDADTGGIVPQRVGPLPTPTGDAPEKD